MYTLSLRDSIVGSTDLLVGQFDGANADILEIENLTGTVSVIASQNSGLASSGLTVDALNGLLNSTNGTKTNRFAGSNNSNLAILTTTDNKTFLAIDVDGAGTFTADDLLVEMTGSTLTSFTTDSLRGLIGGFSESGSNKVTIDGSSVSDSIFSDNSNHTIFGGNGNDFISSGSGNDSISGGSGNDEIWAGGGSNTIDGGDGNDSILGGSGNDTISGGSGNDSIGDDGGSNTIDGGDGDDSIFASDSYSYVQNQTPVLLALSNSTITGGAGNDTIQAGDGNDSISGDLGNDSINGGSGNNTLLGGDGNDTINSGVGNDSITGGAGNDVYIYNSSECSTVGNVDKLFGEFNGSNADKIQIMMGSPVVIASQNSNLASSGLTISALNSLLNSTNGTATTFVDTGSNVAILTTTDSKIFFAIDVDASGTFTTNDMLIDVTGSTLTSVTAGTFL
jgi:Ca2+-binding RTX toxin-like protein